MRVEHPAVRLVQEVPEVLEVPGVTAWESESHGEHAVTSVLGRLPVALASWPDARDVVLVAEGRVELGHHAATHPDDTDPDEPR